MRTRKIPLPLTATLTGMLSFGLTLAAFAAVTGTWPASCTGAGSYGPGGNKCVPPQGADPSWGFKNCLIPCFSACDKACPSIGGPPNTNSICKDCCGNYNYGNTGPNVPVHCLNATAVETPVSFTPSLFDNSDVLNETATPTSN